MNEDRFIRKKQMARMEEPDDLEGMASLEVNRWMFLKKPMAAETGGLGPCLGFLHSNYSGLPWPWADTSSS